MNKNINLDKDEEITIVEDTLGSRVKELRKEKGWTQTDLANMAGVTYQNIQFCESNKIKMPRYIKELAESLGTSIEYLVKGEEQPNVVRLQQHISIVSVDSPVKPDPNFDYHLVKIAKGKQLFVPKDAEIVGQVNKVFIGHTN
jgi:transcriptional regulator with XRE-family HTH domain|tara:strand:+ start:35 stop:463 length:429 start_codon:yes stop_codon:yes gene_type:complete